MKKIYMCIIALLIAPGMKAQDQQFTQFYAVPTQLNPAFAGASVQSRLSMQYRNQWSAIPGAFNAGNVAFDQFLPIIKSGVGFLFSHDRAGSGALRTTSMNFQYAYEAKVKRNLFFRPSLQFGYVTKAIDFNKLNFYDQMIRDNASTSLEQTTYAPVGYFDVASGVLMYGPKFWVGFSAYHLNRPNESVYGSNPALLDRRYTAHGGVRIRLKGNSLTKLDHNLVIAANYMAQADFDQLDLGCYYEFSPIILGFWYRGLAAKSNHYGYINHDMFALLLGIQASRYKIGYSYDITVSQLGIGSSAGSHELTLSYLWSNKKNAKSQKKRIMPCAKF